VSVARILSVAVLINALAFVPFSLIQGKGRPDITAKFHLVELPLYWLLLVLLIKMHGIQGAAVAYAVRVTADAVLLFLYARGLMHDERASTRMVTTP
jgi:O-antigen/teichoic acid export membrane protein